MPRRLIKKFPCGCRIYSVNGLRVEELCKGHAEAVAKIDKWGIEEEEEEALTPGRQIKGGER